MRLAVLVTCFNRVMITLPNLTCLVQALERVDQVDAEVFVVDDGSTDGTSEALRLKLPRVHLVHGSGSLFWSRGMRMAHDFARRHRGFDAYLLFNDDVEVDSYGIDEAIHQFSLRNRTRPTVIVGATTNGSGSGITYSAYRIPARWRPLTLERVYPNGCLQQCDAFNANFVLIPAIEFDAIGGLDPFYHHGLGDIDLGLVLAEAGCELLLASAPVGICEIGSTIEDRVARLDFSGRLAYLFTGHTSFRHFAYFYWKHAPRLLMPLYIFVVFVSHLRLLFQKCKGS